MPAHKNLKRACLEAYGTKSRREMKHRHEALLARLAEMNIDQKNIRVARGNIATRDFPQHVYIAVTVTREGKVITFRRLRFAEDLRILEDEMVVDKPEDRRHPTSTHARDLDYYDNRRDQNDSGKLLPYQSSFGKFED